MKIKLFLSTILAAGLFAGCASEKCESCGKGGDTKTASAMADAKVSMADAQVAALAKLPGGTVKEAKMDKWKGKRYWTFDIVPATGGDAVEVAVDPNSGKVVWMSNEKEGEEDSHAKVSKADAQAAALAKVPGGTIKDGELEKEQGKWIWSFDITLPGSADIKEVAVDAMTGKVLEVATETPADQAKEAAEDAAAAAKKKQSAKADKD